MIGLVAAPAVTSEETIVDVYAAILAFGDKEAHLLVETVDGYTIVHSGRCQKTVFVRTLFFHASEVCWGFRSSRRAAMPRFDPA